MNNRQPKIEVLDAVLENANETTLDLEWPHYRERKEYPNKRECEYEWKISFFDDPERTIPKENADDICAPDYYYYKDKIKIATNERMYLTLSAHKLENDGELSEKHFVYWERDNGTNRKQLSKEDLKKLERKAIDNFAGEENEMVKVTHLYRTKFKDEWKTIIEKDGGRMHGNFRLDNQGHYSPFNNAFRGTFFFVPNSPMNFSKFGDETKKFSLDVIFRQFDDLVFFFADIKCYGNSRHYVAIAICRNGSAQYSYFSQKLRLEPLNKDENPFLRLTTNNNQPTFYVSNENCWVEVFIMEEIHIKQEDESKVQTLDIPYYPSNSQRICPTCPKCNLLIG